jgi:hypothetical protein
LNSEFVAYLNREQLTRRSKWSLANLLPHEPSEIGLEQVFRLKRGQGAFLISVHYSLYSSLLVLWLTRATVQNLFS